MHQSERTKALQLWIIYRFVQWPSPHDDCWLLLCIPDINGIEGCIKLKELSLRYCYSLTGLFSGHHPMILLILCVYFRHRWNWWMHQSEGIVDEWLLFVDRFVQWPSPRDDHWLLLCIPDINGIEGCINLETLMLESCSSLTGLFSGHHPLMITVFLCVF